MSERFFEKVIKNFKKLADDNKSMKIQVMGKVLDFHNGNFQLLIRIAVESKQKVPNQTTPQKAVCSSSILFRPLFSCLNP